MPIQSNSSYLPPLPPEPLPPTPPPTNGIQNNSAYLPPIDTSSGDRPKGVTWDINSFNTKFKEKVGRDLTADEAQWLVTEKAGGFTDPNKLLNEHVQQINTLSSQIMREANAAGVAMTKQEADQLRDQLYNPRNASADDSFLSLARSSIYNQKQKQAEKSVQDKIDAIQNPTVTPELQNTASQVIRETMGRDASQREIDYYAKEMAGGLSAYELQGYLQATPEYQKAQANVENERVKTEQAGARESLNQELLKGQQEAFSRAQPAILSQYLKAGRLNSSGLNQALAQAQADLDRERQGFLSNAAYQDAIRAQGYSRENFVGGQAAAFNQYLRQSEPAYQQRFNTQNASNSLAFQQPFASFDRNYEAAQGRTGREQEIADYYREQSDYERYFNQNLQAQKSASKNQLLGSLLGAGIQGLGAYAGGRFGRSAPGATYG